MIEESRMKNKAIMAADRQQRQSACSSFFAALALLALLGKTAFGRNLALGKQTLQSSTLWNYVSDLAVDEDATTCSFTPKSRSQRWWQVALDEPVTVQAVAVTITEGSYQHFTLFVVGVGEESNSTSFVKCDAFDGLFAQDRTMLQCPGQGIQGHKVYLRDDRKGEQEQLKLCEVEVFGFKDFEDPVAPCPPLAIENGSADVKSLDDGTERATFSCDERFVLWGNSNAECDGRTDRRWYPSVLPTCQPISCGEPDRFQNAYGTVEKLNVSTNLMSEIGDRVVYVCDDGYRIVANKTEGLFVVAGVAGVCARDGKWQIESKFLCVNETVLSAVLQLSGDYDSVASGGGGSSGGGASTAAMPWECVIYTLVVVLLVVLLLIVFCALLAAHKRRRARRQRFSRVTQPRFVADSGAYGAGSSGSSRFLFPEFKAKDISPHENSASTNSSTTSSGPGAQITGYSHSLLYDGEIRLPSSGSMVRGPSVDDVGRRALVGEERVAVAVAAGSPSDRATTEGNALSTFKPINESVSPLLPQQQAGTAGNAIPAPLQYWTSARSAGNGELISLPSNWSLRTKQAPNVAASGGAALTLPRPPKTTNEADMGRSERKSSAPAISAPPSFVPQLTLSASEQLDPPAHFNTVDDDQPRYCNVVTPESHLPEIDEAGYASLIIAPDGTKTLVDITTGDVINTYPNNGQKRDNESPKYQEIGEPINQVPQETENTYQNVMKPEDTLTAMPEDRQVESSENPYVNESADALEVDPDAYAKVDLSKKRRESGVYRAAEAASEKLGARLNDEDEEEEEDLVDKFESFFAAAKLSSDDTLTITTSKC